jgi:endonuclease G, mitochondrial
MKITTLALLAFAVNASAAPTACPNMFAGGQAPDLLSVPLATRSHALCYESYAVLESGVTRTGLWSAEHLTRESVTLAEEQARIKAFHPDASIGHLDRAELEDYRYSGMAQGHLSPSEDAPDILSEWETFSLANMVGQSPDSDRHLWAGIEIATRRFTQYEGEIYVVTGPAFVGPRATLGRRVEVPTHLWKAIYDPKRGAAAYITWNRPGEAYTVVSIAELTRITGIDPFPSLPQATRAHAIELPAPRPDGRKLTVGPVGEARLGLGSPNEVSRVVGPPSSRLPRPGSSASHGPRGERVPGRDAPCVLRFRTYLAK